MRIGMIAPLEIRVPPVTYGGIELVVSLLTEGLVGRGHDVTLFASGDSVTGAKLVSICPHYLRGSDLDRGIFNMLNVGACLEMSDQFDIVHNHTWPEGAAMAPLGRSPVLTTLHGNLEDDSLVLFARYTGWYNTISDAATSLLPHKAEFAGVVYNSIDVSSYPFNASDREPHLLFLGRMSHEKGPHLAIEAARRAGCPLVLAGNISDIDGEYFQTRIAPEIDGESVVYVGEADYELKRDLLLKARCLLAPITWPEPFGLFMAEAGACGTPVVAFNRGAAPEVVADGETGFVVDTLDEMVDAIARIHLIDPFRCREYVARRFDVDRMVEDYIDAYEQILDSPRETERAQELATAGRAG